MEDYRKLNALIRDSSTDVVLDFINTKNITADTYVSKTSRCPSPLGLAIKYGHLLVVNELIRRGFDPTTPCRLDDSRHPLNSLNLACTYNRSDIVLSLLHDHGIDINAVEADGYTALVATIMYNSSVEMIDLVKVLVEAGASVNISCPRGRRTPLSAAIDKHRVSIDLCRYLISKGADVNAKNKDNTTPLMLAIERCASTDVLRLLMASAADVNVSDKDKKSVLMTAIENNIGINVIRLLLNHGADVNALDKNNKSPLGYALKDNYRVTAKDKAMKETVHVLIRFGADVNVLDNNQISPLMHALMRNADIEVIRLLVKSGAYVNGIDMKGKSSLMYAIENRARTDVITFLLRSGADVNVSDKEKETVVMYAIKKKAGIDVIRVLSEYRPDVNALDTNSNSPLYYAIENIEQYNGGGNETVKVLVKSGADVNMLDNTQISPLMHALMRNADIEMIRLLVKSGACVNGIDMKGKSSLMYAIENRARTDVITFLLESGADVNISRNNSTLLMDVITKEEGINVIRLSLAYKADCNALDSNNKSPLRYAIENTRRPVSKRTMKETVHVLLQYGADVNMLDNKLVSPLMRAICNDVDIGVIRLLLESGADVNISDSEHRSPLLHVIAKSARTDVIKLLVEAGADVNVSDSNGKSSFSYAMGNRVGIDNDVISILLESGADVNMVDNDLVSPIMLAIRKGGDSGIIMLLINSGADITMVDTDNKSPLHYALQIHALRNSTWNTVMYLIKCGADVNVLDINNVSPLMLAVRVSDNSNYHKTAIAIVQLLVDSGSDVNIRDENGDTPLMYALKHKARVTLILLLLESGADICARNRDNVCALDFVLENFHQFNQAFRKYGGLGNLFVKSAGNVKGNLVTLPNTMKVHDAFDMIRALCSKGADIEGKDGTGNTVLHQVMSKISQCSCAQCFNLVHFLIVKLNLSLWARNSTNQTPFHYAMNNYHFQDDENYFRQEIAYKILKLCFQVGYTPDSDEMLVVREIEEKYSTVIYKGSDVTSLQHSCCFAVRRALGRRLPTAVNSLHITEKVKQCVTLAHVHPMEETPENAYDIARYDHMYYADDHDNYYYDYEDDAHYEDGEWDENAFYWYDIDYDDYCANVHTYEDVPDEDW